MKGGNQLRNEETIQTVLHDYVRNEEKYCVFFNSQTTATTSPARIKLQLKATLLIQWDGNNNNKLAVVTPLVLNWYEVQDNSNYISNEY